MTRDPLTLACLVGILFISVGALGVSWFSSHSPFAIYGEFLTVPPFWMEGGSSRFFLGTDDLGRDLMTRLLYGGKISLLVGGIVMVMSLVFGLIFGMLAALSKRWEPWVMGAVDIFMSFPGILIAIVVVAILGPGPLKCLCGGKLNESPFNDPTGEKPRAPGDGTSLYRIQPELWSRHSSPNFFSYSSQLFGGNFRSVCFKFQ